VHLDIQIGEHTNDYQQIKAKDKLTELQLRIRQLLDQVEQITKEQNYQRVCILILFYLIFSQRVDFSMDIGPDTEDYEEIVNKEKLTLIELKIRKLSDVTSNIVAEQGFQRVSSCG
jgi:succinylglutamate desuccinylase